MSQTISESEMEYVTHPLLRSGVVEKREYQMRLADDALGENTLVTLPTGLGKTAVSLLLTATRLHEHGGKALFLAPTKPLINQHARFYKEALDISEDEITTFSGEVSPANRERIWDEAQVIIATPQVIENDLIANRYTLEDVTHLTFDECHRGTGDYAYVYVAEMCEKQAKHGLVTAMSASPGSDEENILTISRNLGLTNVTVMTEDDPTVKPYTFDTEAETKFIEPDDELKDISENIKAVIKDRLKKINDLGIKVSQSATISEGKIAATEAQLRDMMNEDKSEAFEAMSFIAEVRKLKRALTLHETQGHDQLLDYFQRKDEERQAGDSKASVRMMSDERIQKCIHLAAKYDKTHPKLMEARLQIINVLSSGGERVILFTESRDTVEMLTRELSENFDVARLVGQGGDDGMTQPEQQQVLEDFEAGEFQVLISTSVAEEGIDIPEVDLVLFYEPVMNPVRTIQRRGRTGRQAEGSVVVLVMKGTTDETAYWVNNSREKQMSKDLETLQEIKGGLIEELGGDGGSQGQLSDFVGSDIGGTDTGTDTPTDSDDSPNDGTPEADGAESSATVSGEEDGTSGADLIEAAQRAAEEALKEQEEAEKPEDKKSRVTAGLNGDDDTVEIVSDDRELDSKITRWLSKQDDVETRVERLEVGDYIVSDRTVFERKSVSDFLDTITGGDRSIFEQIADAQRYYDRVILIIEGEHLYGKRNIHPNAIRGVISSLSVDFGISVIRTTDEQDTAEYLKVSAKREQNNNDREMSVHGEKTKKTLPEQQEYVIGSVVGVGPDKAKRMLTALGSVRAVMNAEPETLLEIEGIGEKTADRFRNVIDTEYEPN